MPPASRLKLFIFLIIPPILWAGNSVVGKFATPYIGPFSLAFFRWLIASIIILSFAAKPLYAARAQLKQHWFILLVFGCLGIGMFNTLLYLGLNFTSANNSSIILAIMPISIFALSYLLGIERSTMAQFLGMLLSIVGVLWVVSNGDFNRVLRLEFNVGDLAVLGAVFVWAMYSVALKKWRPSTISTLPLLAIQIVIGMLFNIPFVIYEYFNHAPILWQQETFWVLAYVGVFPSLFAYYFWQQGIAMASANIAGLFIPFISVFTVIFAFIFIDETLSQAQLQGGLMVIAGVLIAFFISQPKPRDLSP